MILRDIASNHDAPQHRPRPLPLFLDLLRSETAGSSDRMRSALAGLRAYQEAPRARRPAPMPVVARVGRAVVRDYGSSGGRPVLFVPSLINPPDVLDIAEGNSLLRWLATRGIRPLLLDWGYPAPGERDLDVAGHVETLLLPLIAALGEPVALAGYCAGGTMAIAAAARMNATALVLIAAPWNFSGFPDAARADLATLWEQSAGIAEQLGVLPMEVLQTSFWRLDPARTIAKFVGLADFAPDSEKMAAFVTLEDWANDGPPLTFAAGRDLLRDMFGGNITGRGEWHVDGQPVLLDQIACPVLDISSTTDRIVPAASAAAIGDRRSLSLGHVGMIVGGRAHAMLWEPLAVWLSRRADSW